MREPPPKPFQHSFFECFFVAIIRGPEFNPDRPFWARRFVSISFREPVRELDEGEQQVFWNITIEPQFIEADISGFLTGERGSDSLTMCEFTAVEGQAQYDDYRRVHAQAVPDLYLPGFDATTLDALPWDADECSLTVDE